MYKDLSDEKLHLETIQAASREKMATLALLEHLAEVDRRLLYASRGYSSLWEYVHRALGYSEAQASERVSAMRLMCRVPEVRRELETGELTLTSASRLASHVRREKLDAKEAAQLLQTISGKSTRETERLLASASSPPHEQTIRLALDVGQEFMDLIQRVKELRGNPSLGPKDVFELAMTEYVRRREPKPDRVARVLRAPEVLEVPERRSRYVPVPVKNTIRVRSGDRCEYQDPLSGRRCESRSGLQLDHIHPFSRGGQTQVGNLRHLCRAHNQLAAVREFGTDAMSRFLPKLK